MKSTLTTILAFTFLTSAAQAKEDDRKVDDRAERLDAGETVVRAKGTGNKREVEVAALFTSAPEKIWDLIHDCNRYEKTMLRIKESKEVSREGGKIRCRTVVDMPWPMKPLTSLNEAKLTVQPGKKWKREWKLVEGDFVINEGSWTITPHTDNKRMLVVYRSKTQPKAEIPEELRNMAQRVELPKLFRHLKTQLSEE